MVSCGLAALTVSTGRSGPLNPAAPIAAPSIFDMAGVGRRNFEALPRARGAAEGIPTAAEFWPRGVQLTMCADRFEPQRQDPSARPGAFPLAAERNRAAQ